MVIVLPSNFRTRRSLATLAVSREGEGGEREGLLQEVLSTKMIIVPPTYSTTGNSAIYIHLRLSISLDIINLTSLEILRWRSQENCFRCQHALLELWSVFIPIFYLIFIFLHLVGFRLHTKEYLIFSFLAIGGLLTRGSLQTRHCQSCNQHSRQIWQTSKTVNNLVRYWVH